MVDYVYTDHAQYTIKTYAKMALFPLVLTGPLSVLWGVLLLVTNPLYGQIYIQPCSVVLAVDPRSA